jgi:hypothetical protein
MDTTLVALHLLDPVFSNYTHDKRFREIALDLGIKRPVVPQSMYIFKQPHTGTKSYCIYIQQAILTSTTFPQVAR